MVFQWFLRFLKVPVRPAPARSGPSGPIRLERPEPGRTAPSDPSRPGAPRTAPDVIPDGTFPGPANGPGMDP